MFYDVTLHHYTFSPQRAAQIACDLRGRGEETRRQTHGDRRERTIARSRRFSMEKQ